MSKKLLGWKEIPFAGIIPNTPTSLEYKTGTWRAFKPVHNKEKCIKCLLCWIHCPEPAIIRHDDDSIEIDYDYCKGCGICSNVCPVKAIVMVPEGE
ncbi:MAG: ferredoxin [Thermoprotei archaeon]|nr:MAG: ferredoxin [Thermoprotei archaeon]HDD63977.1 4Fe-4S dicluster domain-containing protein [Thermoprotei archaeon]